MTKQTQLTYGQLYDRLQQMGFAKSHVQFNGKRGWAFENTSMVGTMIVLPERDGNEPVEPFYQGLVLAKLKDCNLLPESNPLLTSS